jgi:hypothetical protein
MQQKKRRSKKGVILLALAIAMLVVALLPAAAMAANRISALEFGGALGQNQGGVHPGNVSPTGWFSASANFNSVVGTFTASPLDTATATVGYMYKIDGLPIGGTDAGVVVNFPGSSPGPAPVWPWYSKYRVFGAGTAFAEGMHSLEHWSYDVTATPPGNGTITTDVFGVDKTGPTITQTGLGDGVWHSANVSFTWRVTDPNGSGVAPTPTVSGSAYPLPIPTPYGTTNPVATVVGGAAPAAGDPWSYNGTGTVTATRTVDNAYFSVVKMSAVDMVGNGSEIHPTVQFDLDAPHTGFTTLPMGASDPASPGTVSFWVNVPVTVNFQSGDSSPTPNSGVAYTEYITKTTTNTVPPPTPLIGDTGTQGTSMVVNTMAPDQYGATWLYFRSVDNAVPANKEAWHTVQILFDDLPPVLTDDVPSTWIDAVTHATFAVTDLGLFDAAVAVDQHWNVLLGATDPNSGVQASSWQFIMPTWRDWEHGLPADYPYQDPLVYPTNPVALYLNLVTHETDGIYPFAYAASDNAINPLTGDHNDAFVETEVKIDTRAPRTDGEPGYGDSPHWIDGTRDFVLTATDEAPGAGVAATIYRVDQATAWDTNEAAVPDTQLLTEVAITPVGVMPVQGSVHQIDFGSLDAALPYDYDATVAPYNVPVGVPSYNWGNSEFTHWLWGGGYDQKDHWTSITGYKTESVKLDTEAPVTSVSPDSPVWRTTSPVWLTFTASDIGGSGVAKTEYNVDDNGWVTGLSVELTDQGQTVVDYRSTDNVGLVETAQTTIVNIDSVDPVTSVTAVPLPNAAGWNMGPVLLTFNATDATSGVEVTQYSTDGGATWDSVVDDTLIIDSEDVTQVMYRSIDVAGNVEATKSITLKIDSAAPITTVSPDSSEWVNHDVTLTFTAEPGVSGIAKTEYNVNGNGWVTGQSVHINAEGATDVEYRSVSVAGVVEDTQVTTVYIDSVDPSTTVSASPLPNALGWNSEAVTLTFVATDATSGVAFTEYSTDGGTTWDDVIDGELVISDEGVTNVMYRSVDEAGNVEATKTITIKINMDAPVTTVEPDSSEWNTHAVTLTFTATGGVSGIARTEYNVNGTGWVTGLSVRISAEGETEVEYRSVSGAGVVEDTNTTTVFIDTVDPVSTVSGAVVGWSKVPVTLTFSATDATSGVDYTEFSINGGTTWTKAGSATISTNGTTVVMYRAVDNATNVEAAKSVTVMVDSTVPVTTVTGNDSNWHSVPVTLDFSATGGGVSGIAYTEWSTDGGANWTKGNSAIISANGETMVSYRSVSNAGAVEVAKVTGPVLVSTIAPLVTTEAASVKKGNKAKIHFAVASVTPLAATVVIEIRQSGQTKIMHRYNNVTANTSQSKSFRVNLPKGKYWIRVGAVDQAGNVQATMAIARLTVR